MAGMRPSPPEPRTLPHATDENLRIRKVKETPTPGTDQVWALYCWGHRALGWSRQSLWSGGHTAGSQTEPLQPPPHASLTTLPLPRLGLPKAPPASASLLLLPLPLTVAAFFRCSTERGGCRLRVGGLAPSPTPAVSLRPPGPRLQPAVVLWREVRRDTHASTAGPGGGRRRSVGRVGIDITVLRSPRRGPLTRAGGPKEMQYRC